ncbi:hypothetical protein [Persephonella sp.]
MRKLIIISVILFTVGISFGENTEITENTQTQEETTSVSEYRLPSEDDSYLNRYFLVERFNFLPIIRDRAEEIGITIEQMEEIKKFYKEFYDLMVEKANEIKEKEDELKKLVLEGGEAKRIKQLIVDIAKLKAELTIYNIKEVRAIQNALTENQWKKVLELAQSKVF